MTIPIKKAALYGASAIALACGSYYLASPYLAVNGLRNAFVTRNSEEASKYIDYPSLQSDLKQQIGAIMLKNMQSDPEMANNPFSSIAVAMITPMVNSMVDAYVTPAGLKMILETSPRVQANGGQEQMTANLAEQAKAFNEALKKTSMSYEGLNKFKVSASGADGQTTTLFFNREGFADWKIKSMILPQQ